MCDCRQPSLPIEYRLSPALSQWGLGDIDFRLPEIPILLCYLLPALYHSLLLFH
ncbi:hypothetical protein Tsubulata_010868, partial [Turnera subulata]